MHDVEVRFFEDSSFYNPGNPQRVHGKTYNYLSFFALNEGDVVIVPTYGDRYPNLRLTFARVERVVPSIGDPSPSLRYVIQRVDLEGYETMMAQQRDRERAIRVLKAARKKRQRIEEYAEVLPFLSPEDAGFVRKTLEFEFDDIQT